MLENPNGFFMLYFLAHFLIFFIINKLMMPVVLIYPIRSFIDFMDKAFCIFQKSTQSVFGF